jgi:hypothetical protein
MSVFLLIAAWAVFFPSLAKADIATTSGDFGDVVVGTEGLVFVTVQNTGSQNVDLYYYWMGNPCGFVADESVNFQSIAPGDSVDIAITWTPSVEGSCSASLDITHQFVSLQKVVVTGNAISAVQKAPTISGLLEFFDGAVGSGGLEGKGPGKSARHRLNAFRNMLVEAGSLCDQGMTEEACGQLQAAKKKLGVFVTASSGDSLAELENRINQVLDSLSAG